MIRKNLLSRRLQPSSCAYSPVSQPGESPVKSELTLGVRPRIERRLVSGVLVHIQHDVDFAIRGKLEANATFGNEASGSKPIR